jgi:hypothetical protein
MWRVEAEHRLTNSPLSGIIAFSHERNETDFNDVSVDTNTLWLGMRFYLDQPTLRANDRSGVEFETPTFGNSLEAAGATSQIPLSMVVTAPPA